MPYKGGVIVVECVLGPILGNTLPILGNTFCCISANPPFPHQPLPQRNGGQCGARISTLAPWIHPVAFPISWAPDKGVGLRFDSTQFPRRDVGFKG